jgi:hypothetical protein
VCVSATERKGTIVAHHLEDELTWSDELEFWLDEAVSLEAAGNQGAALGALQLALGAEYFAQNPDATLYEMRS